jgi:fused signal recognition particle receptor
MAKWFKALTKSRKGLTGALANVFSRKRPLDAETLEDLEEALLGADVAPRLAAQLIAELEKNSRGQDVDGRQLLKDLLLKRFDEQPAFDWANLPHGACVLVVGVNGSGKTTSTAKLSHMAQDKGLQPLMGAADTFRAAGTEQLRMWAEMVNCDVVAGEQGSDAAAVAYDALAASIARDKDILFIDTAGRMHNKAPLMEELRKIVRSLNKCLPEAPHETWIVLDASIGQNALVQARMFNEVTPLTGVVITKLDGSSKAGFLFSVKEELGVPILFTGLGELKEDLIPFSAEEFVDGLLDMDGEEQADA